MAEANNSIRIRIAVLIVRDERMLLVQHQKPGRRYWLLPGGGLEYGETIEQCARRELLEETGLEIEPGPLLFVQESIPPDGHRHVVNLYLSARVTGGELDLGAEDVLADVQWVPLDDIPGLTLYPPVTDELLRAARGEPVTPLLLGNRWDS